jgi:hypothetical protein
MQLVTAHAVNIWVYPKSLYVYRNGIATGLLEQLAITSLTNGWKIGMK